MIEPLKIGGVPEHFNLPWQLALERNLFQDQHIDLEWSFFAGGTGAMTKALNRGDLDMAILLTEGYFSALKENLQALIVKVYIETPLVWGIYTGAHSGITHPFTNRQGKTAISRFGSGSHLMSIIDAAQHGVSLAPDSFCEVNSLHGAIDALSNGDAGYFYWEKFMTKPYLQEGLVRLIGDFKAPWSGFLVVAGKEALQNKSDEIYRVLEIMNELCAGFKQESATPIELKRRFEMTERDVAEWLNGTTWNTGFDASLESFTNARSALANLKLCSSDLDISKCCAPWLHLKS